MSATDPAGNAAKRKRNTWKDWLLLLTLGWALIATDLHCSRRGNIPAGPLTLANFEERYPSGVVWSTFTRSGQPFVIARYRAFTGLLTFKSGQSAFVFDPQGRLVDWTPDDGDDSAFRQRNPEPTSAPSTTRPPWPPSSAAAR